MKVAVIGGGSWGTALSIHLGRLDIPVRLWIREEDVCDEVLHKKTNSAFLPGFLLPPRVSVFRSLEEAAGGANLVFVAVPSRFCRSLYEELAHFLDDQTTVVSLTKGIEERTLKRMSEVMAEVLPFDRHPHPAVVSGPSFAREVAAGLPTAVVVASPDYQTATDVQHLLSGPAFRVYTSRDVTGVELAGALKNIIAIAAGISDALESGHNSRAALISRGLAEMARLGEACGARRETFSGLAGIGDLILTCTGELSRNRQVGLELGKGRPLADILNGMRMVAEGVGTTLSVKRLAGQKDVEMPICEQVYRILYEGRDPREALVELMSRTLKEE